MTYIKRDIEKTITKLNKEYSYILLTGSRQVGKSTLLKIVLCGITETKIIKK